MDGQTTRDDDHCGDFLDFVVILTDVVGYHLHNLAHSAPVMRLILRLQRISALVSIDSRSLVRSLGSRLPYHPYPCLTLADLPTRPRDWYSAYAGEPDRSAVVLTLLDLLALEADTARQDGIILRCEHFGAPISPRTSPCADVLGNLRDFHGSDSSARLLDLERELEKLRAQMAMIVMQREAGSSQSLDQERYLPCSASSSRLSFADVADLDSGDSGVVDDPFLSDSSRAARTTTSFSNGSSTFAGNPSTASHTLVPDPPPISNIPVFQRSAEGNYYNSAKYPVRGGVACFNVPPALRPSAPPSNPDLRNIENVPFQPRGSSQSAINLPPPPPPPIAGLPRFAEVEYRGRANTEEPAKLENERLNHSGDTHPQHSKEVQNGDSGRSSRCQMRENTNDYSDAPSFPNVLQQLQNVRLRTVKINRSPGGTPLRRGKGRRSGPTPGDPAAFIAAALQRKFAGARGQVSDSPTSSGLRACLANNENSDPDDGEDNDWNE